VAALQTKNQKPNSQTTFNQHSCVRGPLRECHSILSGASGLPHYCAPLVCVSEVIELLAVWQHYKPKTKKGRVGSGSRRRSMAECWGLWTRERQYTSRETISERWGERTHCYTKSQLTQAQLRLRRSLLATCRCNQAHGWDNKASKTTSRTMLQRAPNTQHAARSTVCCLDSLAASLRLELLY